VPEEPRLRRRLLAVGLAALAVAATGLFLDHTVGARAVGPGVAGGRPTGAWYCPHGGGPGWRAWVVVSNPGTAPVDVRLTQLAGASVRSVGTFTVGALRQVYREVAAEDPADVATVEYFGGWVGVSAVVRSEAPSGVAAEHCEDGPRHTWFLLDQTTAAGDASQVVVMNPFAADAAFDVVMRTEGRTITPGALTPYVLKGNSSVAIRINDYALESPGEETVTVEVTQRIGRIVAGGSVSTEEGLRAETGAAEPAEVTMLPLSGFVGPPRVILLNPQEDPADVSVLASGRTGQQVVAATFTLEPGTVKTLIFSDFPGSTAVVRSDNKEPIVASARATGPFGDLATLTGATTGSKNWLVMPATTLAGGKSFLVLHNPGDKGVRVSVQLIGSNGTVPAPRLSSVLVAPGRTSVVGLAGPAKGAPVTVVARSEGGTFVASIASIGRGGAGYAVTLGLPMKE
jgi:uncharacterized protein DUF5719